MTAARTRASRWRDVVLVVLVAMLHAAVFAAIVPPWQAPDEPKHYEHVALVHELGRPVSRELAQPSMQWEIVRSMERYEFWRWGFGDLLPPDRSIGLPFVTIWQNSTTVLDRPPLFYLLTSPLFGLLTGPPGDRLPALRVWSVFLSSLTIGVVYLTARSIFPGRASLALGAAAFAALVPMYAFIGGSLNSDHLANLVSALLIYALVRGYQSAGDGRTGLAALLLMIAGFYTKRTTFFAFPIALIVLIGRAIKTPGRGLRIGLVGAAGAAALLAVATLVFPGPRHTIVYLLNRYVADVSFSWNLDLLASRSPSIPALAVLLHHFLWGLLESFWARFGWMNLMVDIWLYQAVLAANLVALLGLFVLAGQLIWRPARFTSGQRASIGLLALLLFSALLVPIAQFTAYFTPSYVPQGRYLFPAMVPIAILFVLGFQSLAPRLARGLVTFALVTALFVFDAACIFLYVVPHYYG